MYLSTLSTITPHKQLFEQEVNYKQAITTGKLLTYLILLLTGKIGDRGRKEKLKITVKRKKCQALGTAYTVCENDGI